MGLWMGTYGTLAIRPLNELDVIGIGVRLDDGHLDLRRWRAINGLPDDVEELWDKRIRRYGLQNLLIGHDHQALGEVVIIIDAIVLQEPDLLEVHLGSRDHVEQVEISTIAHHIVSSLDVLTDEVFEVLPEDLCGGREDDTGTKPEGNIDRVQHRP